MLVIGLMSGTSADAIDAALVEWPDEIAAAPFTLLAFREFPLDRELQTAIHGLAAGEIEAERVLAEQIRLDRLLGDRFADATEALLGDASIAASRVAAIASHGQTVAHHPELGGTLQIGCPARLAERLERPVVADFRRRDLALGGEGAPLAPFFHHAVFARADVSAGVLNLGGISNLTWLPAGGAEDGVIAFDVGPANALTDGVVALATGGAERFDRGGARARRGRIVDDWLSEILADPYLSRPPPKSTGREHYGLAQARAWLDRSEREGVGLDDLLATLVAGSVRAVAGAWHDVAREEKTDSSARLYVGGGGARNAFVMESLAEALPEVEVTTTDAAGVPSDAAEAMAFSLMGRNVLLGLPNHLPRTTGAARARILGVVHGAEFRGGEGVQGNARA